MRYLTICLLCLGFMLMTPCLSTASQALVGIVKTLEGDATVLRGAETITVVAGMEIQQADLFKTRRNGHLGLVFSDDTRITMGPNTQIVVDDYLFEPKEKRLSFIVRLISGTVSFLSGQMAKLSPDSVQLVMPAATIGVRGTHVLVKVD